MFDLLACVSETERAAGLAQQLEAAPKIHDLERWAWLWYCRGFSLDTRILYLQAFALIASTSEVVFMLVVPQ